MLELYILPNLTCLLHILLLKMLLMCIKFITVDNLGSRNLSNPVTGQGAYFHLHHYSELCQLV